MNKEKATQKTAQDKEARATSTVTIASLAYLVLGAIMIIWPQAIGNALCYILGAALTVYGLFNIITFFRNRDYNLYFELIVGVLATAFGIYTLFSPFIIVKIIYTVIGIVIIIDSLMDIKRAFTLKTLGMKYWWVCIAISVAVIILGICTVIFQNFFGDFIIMLLGIILVYEGVSGLVIMFMIGHYSKKNFKNKKMIDAKATDLD